MSKKMIYINIIFSFVIFVFYGCGSLVVSLQNGEIKDSIEIAKDMDKKEVNKKQDGKYPLIVALKHKQDKIIKILLDKGANVNVDNGEKSALDIAFENYKNSHPNSLFLLLQKKAKFKKYSYNDLIKVLVKRNDTYSIEKFIKLNPEHRQQIISEIFKNGSEKLLIYTMKNIVKQNEIVINNNIVNKIIKLEDKKLNKLLLDKFPKFKKIILLNMLNYLVVKDGGFNNCYWNYINGIIKDNYVVIKNNLDYFLKNSKKELYYLLHNENSSKILLYNGTTQVDLEFSKYYSNRNLPIKYNNRYLIIDGKNIVDINKFRINKRLTKRLLNYLKLKKLNVFHILGSNKNLLYIVRIIKKVDRDRAYDDKLEIIAYDLLKNKEIFDKVLVVPGRNKIIFAVIDYISQKNMNYFLIYSQDDKKQGQMYLLSISNKGSYKLKKLFEKDANSEFGNGMMSAKFNIYDNNNIYFGNYKFDLKTNKLTKFKNFGCDGKYANVFPLSKYNLLCRNFSKNIRILYSYDIKTKEKFIYFDQKYYIPEVLDLNRKGSDGNGDIFIRYGYFESANSEPINKIYMLDAKNKVLMGEGFISGRTIWDNPGVLLLKHHKIKDGVYKYVLGDRKTHKVHHYYLVDTKKLKDYKYIKPKMIKYFNKIAPSLKLKNPKIILTENNIHFLKYYLKKATLFHDYYFPFFDSYYIPYMIKDGNLLYVLINRSSFFVNRTAVSISYGKVKLKIKNKIFYSNGYEHDINKVYPNDNYVDIHHTPEKTRVILFKLSNDINLKKGDVLSVGEELYPAINKIQVLNFKISNIF